MSDEVLEKLVREIIALRRRVAHLETLENPGLPTNIDADTLDGQHGSYYRDASNLNAGTVPLARIPTPLTGKDADTLDGQHGSYYAAAANLSAHTAATSAVHGLGSGVSLVGCKQGTRRIEVQVGQGSNTYSGGDMKVISVNVIWANAFSSVIAMVSDMYPGGVCWEATPMSGSSLSTTGATKGANCYAASAGTGYLTVHLMAIGT